MGRNQLLASTVVCVPFTPSSSGSRATAFCAASSLLEKRIRGEGFGVCAVAEVQCSALCLASVQALLVHSMLSCRVMDLFPAACGMSSTESAWAASHNNTKPLKNDAF